MKYFLKGFFSVILIVNTFGQTNDTIWTKLTPLDTSERTIYDVHFLDQDLGFVSGMTLPHLINGLYGIHVIGKTIDGGTSWDTTVTVFGGWGRFIDFLNDSIGFAGGPNILRTTDSGGNWEMIFSLSGGEVISIEFTDKKNGWAAGIAPPRIFRTNDAGLTWTEKFPDDTLNQGFFISAIDSNTVYIASDSYLYLTDDGGETWRNISIPASFDIFRIKEIIFITKDYGLVFSEYCSVLITRDGGKTWFDRSTTACEYPVSAADAIDSLSITVATSGGEILRTDDGGINWTHQLTAEPFTRFNRIDMVNKNVSYVVGHLGIMYKTTNGGVTYLSENRSITPKQYYLSNNYPNPFNPSTNITFELPESGFVEITLYDIRGRELKTLLNENKRSGTYQLSINLADYPSGVYLYTLQTENYSQTNKMILLK